MRYLSSPVPAPEVHPDTAKPLRIFHGKVIAAAHPYDYENHETTLHERHRLCSVSDNPVPEALPAENLTQPVSFPSHTACLYETPERTSI